MATFITRIELRKTGGVEPTFKDYDKLHKAMEDEGFGRQLLVGGVKQHLPPAEYIITADLTGPDIHTKADRAAAATGFNHSILVTQSAGIWATGLDPVKPTPTNEELIRAALQLVRK